MTTDSEQTQTAATLHRPDLKPDAERHHPVIETQFNPALTLAVAWASAIASLSAAVLVQTQLVFSAAARQMLIGRVPRPQQLQFDERPAAEGATTDAQDDRPTGPGSLVADVFDEVLELLVDVDIADSI
jgi:glycerol uptake facilitator-like aquaporin